METALFLNGVYEDVLIEVLAAQTKHSGPNFLQPYSGRTITLLEKLKPSAAKPVTLYLSTTKDLGHVSYQAHIVRWQDKRSLTDTEKAPYNEQIKVYQSGETEIYLTANDKPCVNLLFVQDMEKFAEPIPVSCFKKAKDHTPLQKRSQAGGWSYVLERPAWLGRSETHVADYVDQELQARVALALQDSASSRSARLAAANPKPASIEVVARAFRRNPDVIAEVLIRAGGKCEHCGKAAPFLRKSDGSPYLEVHHKHMLADGGDDTVENAIALCPNCHRQSHYGAMAVAATGV